MTPQSCPPPVNFDNYAAEYRRLLDESVAAFGEPGEYYSQVKARYLVRRLGAGFAGNILEYGCGVGVLASSLLHAFPHSRFHGFDISPASIAAIPAELAQRAFFTAQPSLLARDYDLIVMANVLHHVPVASRRDLVKQLGGLLAPGGRLVTFEHNPLNPLTRRAVNLCPFDKDAVLLSPRELLGYCCDARLGIVHRDYIVFFPHAFRRLRPLEQLLPWCPLGAQYVVTASKPA